MHRIVGLIKRITGKSNKCSIDISLAVKKVEVLLKIKNCHSLTGVLDLHIFSFEIIQNKSILLGTNRSSIENL